MKSFLRKAKEKIICTVIIIVSLISALWLWINYCSKTL